VVAGLAHVRRRGPGHPSRHPLRRHLLIDRFPVPLRKAVVAGQCLLIVAFGRSWRLRLAGGRVEQPVVLARARAEPPLALPFVGRRRRAHSRLRIDRTVRRHDRTRALGSALRRLGLDDGRLSRHASWSWSGSRRRSSSRWGSPACSASCSATSPCRSYHRPGGGSQSWVLLAVPTFVFAGALMERCGMSYALVNLARGLVGWVRGGLGMSVGWPSTSSRASRARRSRTSRPSADADAAHAARRLQARARRLVGGVGHGHGHSGAAGHLHDRSRPDHGHVGRRHLLGGFIPAAVTAACLMVVIFFQAHRLGWPKDERPSWASLGVAFRASLVPLVARS